MTRVWLVEHLTKSTHGFTLWANFSWQTPGGLVAEASFARKPSGLTPLGGMAFDIVGDDGPSATINGTS